MASEVTEHEQQILDQFTKQAEPFALAPSHSTEESLRVLLETAEVNADDEVLDVACGPGIVSCALAAIAGHVTGLDVVPAMLDQASQLEQRKGLHNVRWQLGSATALPFANDTFSLVVTRYSFHHLLDPAAALREMSRVCQPGGRVVVADVTPESGKAAGFDELERWRDPSHTRALPLDDLLQMGGAQGLKLHKSGSYRLVVSVAELLGDSFLPEGNATRYTQAVRADIGIDRLSIGAYEIAGVLRFRIPISIVSWKK